VLKYFQSETNLRSIQKLKFLFAKFDHLDVESSPGVFMQYLKFASLFEQNLELCCSLRGVKLTAAIATHLVALLCCSVLKPARRIPTFKATKMLVKSLGVAVLRFTSSG
jgi:hypothetical protein